MTNRAYSMLNIKAVDEKERVFRGTATTPTPDRMGDIIRPEGVHFTNPMPLLWQHFHDQPIGEVSFDEPTAKGIDFEAKIANIAASESENLAKRLDEAWASIKHKLVRAVSIGFRELKYAFMENGGIDFMETEVYELSAVTIPANPDAVIASIKSMSKLTSDIEIIKALDAATRRAQNIPDPVTPVAPTTIGQKRHPVVRLGSPARDAAPFVIKKIHPEGIRS